MESNLDHQYPSYDSDKSFNRLCRTAARIFQIEELAVSALEEQDNVVSSVEPEAILAFRKES